MIEWEIVRHSRYADLLNQYFRQHVVSGLPDGRLRELQEEEMGTFATISSSSRLFPLVAEETYYSGKARLGLGSICESTEKRHHGQITRVG
jgi:hypothetical protein